MENIEYKPFGLSTFRDNELRRRTISDYTFYYHCIFKPKNIEKSLAANATQSFKNPTNEEDYKEGNRMISDSVSMFDQLPCFGFKTFNVILYIPSSSNAVNRIKLEINKKVSSDCIIVGKPFVKTRIRNLQILQSQLDRENSTKTKRMIYDCYFKIRKNQYDRVTRMHYIPTRARRYFTNFFKWDKKIDLTNLVGKNILVVDDTLGEGISLREVMWLIEKDLKPNLLCGFVVMKDIL